MSRGRRASARSRAALAGRSGGPGHGGDLAVAVVVLIVVSAIDTKKENWVAIVLLGLVFLASEWFALPVKSGGRLSLALLPVTIAMMHTGPLGVALVPLFGIPIFYGERGDDGHKASALQHGPVRILRRRRRAGFLAYGRRHDTQVGQRRPRQRSQLRERLQADTAVAAGDDRLLRVQHRTGGAGACRSEEREDPTLLGEAPARQASRVRALLPGSGSWGQ